VTIDPILMLVRYAKDLGLTPDDLEHAAQEMRNGPTTLRTALGRIDPAQVAIIKKKYPQGYPTLMDGRPAEYGLPAIRGFGDRSYYDLTTANLAPMLTEYQHHVAAKKRARHGNSDAGRGPRDGAGAARQLGNAANAVAHLLVANHCLAVFPLAGLKAPKGPGSPRDKALSVAEVRDYCQIVLVNSPDPVMDAYVWILFRTTGARRIELERLREVDLNLDRPSITLVGKGGPRREIPIHRQLAQHLHDTMAARPPAPDRQLLRNTRGTPFKAKTVERWSKDLHHQAEWAAPYPMRAHTIRTTVARLIVGQGQDKSAAGLWLGHAPPRENRVTDIYAMDSTGRGEWDQNVSTLEAVFGPLDGWPVLPENDFLAAVLDVDLPLPPKVPEEEE
jgi:integrase